MAQEFELNQKTFRVRLFNCVADLPATRAAMGLLGHMADQGKEIWFDPINYQLIRNMILLSIFYYFITLMLPYTW